MARGFPGKRDDPYRAGITTMTDGVALVITEHLRELLRRDGCGTDHTDDNTGRMIGQRRRISHSGAGRQGEGQCSDHRIAGAGDLEDLASPCGNVPGDTLSLVQTHSLFATGNEHGLTA